MLKGKDAEFEMVTSNCIQPLRLEYQGKLVTSSIAYIFVATQCNKTLNMTKMEKDQLLMDFMNNDESEQAYSMEDMQNETEENKEKALNDFFCLPWNNAE